MLQDKVAVVTGAGRGIGREIALLMANRGAKVVVNDLGAELDGEGADTSPAAETVAEIKRAGGEAVINGDSVADPVGAKRIIEQALDSFGRIDAVVNNAGILRDKIFHRMENADWEMVVGVHLMGSFYVSSAAAPHFRKQNSGSYVHFTSTSGLIGNMGQANYAAAKLGIMGLSKSIALDMQKFNVRSNCVAPFAWSRMIGSIPVNSPEQQARVDKLRQMTPAKIAPMVTVLASDAAANVSGQVFGVRNNEIFLFSQPRPIRSVQRTEGWTPEAIAEHALPAMEKSFYDLDVSADVFSWDPV
ncbi:MAG: NAD(P)-dependent dehydrogenase (short-subunit alcohol dehydrogenase family) [Gammaproteobacteria bacterium]|jgi:NAD(P)-dependent dehydrogenase (short-subunit alcohol dehydrogenase family)